MDALGDPVRRRLVELLGTQRRSAGALATAVAEELGLSQPAVSRHLRVLREAGVVDVEQDGTRRMYAVRPEALVEVEAWAARVVGRWQPHLDALATEVARGRRDVRAPSTAVGAPASTTDREEAS